MWFYGVLSVKTGCVTSKIKTFTLFAGSTVPEEHMKIIFGLLHVVLGMIVI